MNTEYQIQPVIQGPDSGHCEADSTSGTSPPPAGRSAFYRWNLSAGHERARGLEPAELEAMRPSSDPIEEHLDHPFLVEWCLTKNLTPADLVPLGTRVRMVTPHAYGAARWAERSVPGELIWLAPRAARIRDLTETDPRWQRRMVRGSSLDAAWIIPGADRDTVAVVEGETDGARLRAALTCDVLILGGVAAPPAVFKALTRYRRVLVATDADTAGDLAFARIGARVPWAQRWRPDDGAKDMCDRDTVPPLPQRDTATELRSWAAWIAGAGHTGEAFRERLEQANRDENLQRPAEELAALALTLDNNAAEVVAEGGAPR